MRCGSRCSLVVAAIVFLSLHVACGVKGPARVPRKAGAGGGAGGAAPAKQVAPQRDLRQEAAVDFIEWYREMQKLGARYAPGKTQVQTDIAWEAFRKDFEAEVSGRIVEMTMTIKGVNWNDGAASIRGEEWPEDMRKSTKPASEAPLNMSRSAPISVNCTRNEAARIQPGSVLRIRAELSLHTTSLAIFPSISRAQPLHSVSHRLFPGSFAGLLISHRYVVDIDGQPFEGTWSSER